MLVEFQVALQSSFVYVKLYASTSLVPETMPAYGKLTGKVSPQVCLSGSVISVHFLFFFLAQSWNVALIEYSIQFILYTGT